MQKNNLDIVNPENTEFLLLRHGKAQHNTEKVATFAGGRLDTELTIKGCKELDPVIKKIIIEGGCDIIVCSTLRRSKQTAEVIALGIKKKTGKRPEIKIINNLQEIDVGEFTGHTGQWAKENYPGQANQFYHGDIHKWDFPSGENYRAVVRRVQSVIEQLKTIAKSGQKIVIVGHGMFDKVFLSVIFPKKEDLWQSVDYDHNRLTTFNLDQLIQVRNDQD